MLILDEPTAVLTPAETDELFRIIRQLQDGGTRSSSSRTSSGRSRPSPTRSPCCAAARWSASDRRRPAEDELAALMVGRDVQLRVSKEPAKPGDVVLDVADLTVADETAGSAVNGLSFQVRAGEILGVAGVQGNGQTELCEALMGLRPTVAGQVTLNGARPHPRHAPASGCAAGVAYVPEDRQEDGLSATSRSPRTSCSTCTTGRRSPPASTSTSDAIARQRGRAGRGVRRPHHLGAAPRSARCPAATSRRSSWPGSSGASTRC